MLLGEWFLIFFWISFTKFMEETWHSSWEKLCWAPGWSLTKLLGKALHCSWKKLDKTPGSSITMLMDEVWRAPQRNIIEFPRETTELPDIFYKAFERSLTKLEEEIDKAPGRRLIKAMAEASQNSSFVEKLSKVFLRSITNLSVEDFETLCKIFSNFSKEAFQCFCKKHSKAS